MERELPVSENPSGPLLTMRRPVGTAARFVERIVGYEERGVGLPGSIETATLIVPLVISFGEAFSIGLGRRAAPSERYGSFTSGLFAGPVHIASSGRAACIQIDFTIPGACRFFRLPLSELAGRMVALEDLDDAGLALLRRRLGDAGNWQTRLDLAERFVAERLVECDETDTIVERVCRAVGATGGRVRVTRMAESLGLSRRHLTDRFVATVGLGPKTVARMARFQSALAMAGNNTEWADVAAACGYADQAHLTREFAEFAGTTPARWLAKPA